MDFKQLNWTVSSTGGTYLKSEYVENSIRYFCKLSDYSFGCITSHESVLEVIASRLGIALGLPVLEYTGVQTDIVVDNKIINTYVCKTADFHKSNQSSMPLVYFYHLRKLGNRETILEFCQRIGLTTYMDYIFIFDYLIMNTDRHGRNIEIMSDGTDIMPAPVFDGGRCLTFNCGNSIENIQKFNYKENVIANNFVGGLYLENNLRYVSRQYNLPRLTEAMRAIIFDDLISDGVLSEEHAQILWKAVQYRYKRLQDLGVIM